MDLRQTRDRHPLFTIWLIINTTAAEGLNNAIAAIGQPIKQGREHLCNPKKFSDKASPIDP